MTNDTIILNPDDMPSEYLEWVAHEGHEPTKITHPVNIDYRAVHELAGYHPVNIGINTYEFKHVLVKRGDGYIVKAIDINPLWTRTFRALLASLEMEAVYNDSGDKIEYLIDKNEKTSESMRMGDWTGIEWKVVKNRDTFGLPLHQDIITWRNSKGLEIESLLSWNPYLTGLEEAARFRDVVDALNLK